VEFVIEYLAKKVVFFVYSGKNEISSFFRVLKKSLDFPGKIHYSPTMEKILPAPMTRAGGTGGPFLSRPPIFFWGHSPYFYNSSFA